MPTTTATRPSVLTLRQAADYLQVHHRTLGDLARAGLIPAARIGNRWRFRTEALNEWLRDKEQRNAQGYQ